jgi:hypothetical protein
VVERQRPSPVQGIEDDGPLGVVGAFGRTRRPGQKDRRDSVETGVPGRVGVSAELADEADFEAGLFAGFADGGGFERLAVIHEPARQSPAMGRVLAFDEDDAPDPPARSDLDDDVDRWKGVPVFARRHRGQTSSAIVGAGRASCQRLRPEAVAGGDCPRFSGPVLIWGQFRVVRLQASGVLFGTENANYDIV